jgi:hypothetical protein
MLTAVDRDVSTGHEGGLVGAKIDDQTGDLVGCTETPKRYLWENLRIEHLLGTAVTILVPM